MSRAPEELLAELDYWRPVLDDLKVLNDAVSAASYNLSGVPLECAVLVIGGDALVSSTRISKSAGAAMHELVTAIERVQALIDLVGGRLIACERELHGGEEGSP